MRNKGSGLLFIVGVLLQYLKQLKGEGVVWQDHLG